MKKWAGFLPTGQPLLSLVGLVVLVGSCPDVSPTLSNWTDSVGEARDDLRVNQPDWCSRNVERVRVPFGWRLKSPQCQSERIILEHYSGSKAIIWERPSGTGHAVDWHVTFRRDEQDCVATGGFGYRAVEDDGLCLSPPVRISGKSMLVRHIFVRWPAEERSRLEAALQTKTASGICTR